MNDDRMHKRVMILEIAVLFLGVLIVINTLVILEHNAKAHTERIEVLPVERIAGGPRETKSYICTSGVTVRDLRQQCDDCDLWFHGEGQCAVVLP
jgi:hypothetical protein